MTGQPLLKWPHGLYTSVIMLSLFIRGNVPHLYYICDTYVIDVVFLVHYM